MTKVDLGVALAMGLAFCVIVSSPDKFVGANEELWAKASGIMYDMNGDGKVGDMYCFPEKLLKDLKDAQMSGTLTEEYIIEKGVEWGEKTGVKRGTGLEDMEYAEKVYNELSPSMREAVIELNKQVNDSD